jgi:NADH:ubiquinone oxidoreductase subunit E
MTVTVCVGSSCHLKGARKVIVRFSELLREHGLTDRVTLKGSFCMERCGAGVNWRIDEEPVTSASEAEAEALFRRRVVEPLCGSIAPAAPRPRPECSAPPN